MDYDIEMYYEPKDKYVVWTSLTIFSKHLLMAHGLAVATRRDWVVCIYKWFLNCCGLHCTGSVRLGGVHKQDDNPPPQCTRCKG